MSLTSSDMRDQERYWYCVFYGLFRSSLRAVNADFAQVADRIELEWGEMAVIGDKSELITAVCQEEIPNGGGKPKIALDRRMADGQIGSVCGTTKFGIHRGNSFELFGWPRDVDRKTHQNWIGFDYAGETSQVLGMPLQLRALL